MTYNREQGNDGYVWIASAYEQRSTTYSSSKPLSAEELTSMEDGVLNTTDLAF